MQKENLEMNEDSNDVGIIKKGKSMTKFIGIEYLIGNAFIYLTKDRFISLKDINKYRILMQNYFISANNDAIITGEVEYALNSFKDYFKFDRKCGVICLNSNISNEILRERFVWYLSDDIAKSFEKVAKNFK